MPFVAKVVVTKLRSLREEMAYMEVYWRRSAPYTHFETDGVALCAACFKTLRDEAPVASWEMGCFDLYWRRSTQDSHFETGGAAQLAVCFKSLCDEALGASWRNGLYGYILAVQHSRFTFWNRRRGTACRLFQKSLWRSSRRFVEKWVVWMYTGDAAPNMHILKQTAWRYVPCVSKVFVTKLPSLRGDIGWNRRRGAVCRLFQKSSWRSSRRFVGKWVVWIYIGDAALKIDILRQAAPHSVPSVSKVFVTKLSALRGEMGCMDVYWWRSAQHAHFETDGVALCAMCFKSLRDEAPVASWGYGLKQTAWRCVPSVSKVVVTKLPSLRGEMGCMDIYWRRSAQDWHFETGGAAQRAVCFKSLCDEALGASWRNGLYGWILVTQRSTCTFWNRRRGAVCHVFQKSSWRSSRRFVDEVTHISRSDGIVKVLKLMAIWLIWGIAVCFKSAST